MGVGLAGEMKHKAPLAAKLILAVSIFIFIVLHVLGYIWLKVR